MAVSGKTAAPIEAPYALSTDKPTDMPTLTKTMAERQHVLLEQRDAQIQAGGVAGHFSSVGVPLTRTSTALGALSTPVKVTLPRVEAGQLIEIICQGYAESTIGTTKEPPAGIVLGMVVGGTLRTLSEPLQAAERVPGTIPANSFYRFALAERTFIGSSTTDPPITPLGPPLSTQNVMRLPASAEKTPLVIELQGASLSSGTLTVESVYLAARTWG
jgi:hypothetical protein